MVLPIVSDDCLVLGVMLSFIQSVISVLLQYLSYH